MELGRSAWIRRERLERIATAERDRRAGRHCARDRGARRGERMAGAGCARIGAAARRRGLHTPAGCSRTGSTCGRSRRACLCSDGAPRSSILRSYAQVEEAPPGPAFDEFQFELDRPIEAGELEHAFAEAEAQVDEMHDVNRLAERVLFDEPHSNRWPRGRGARSPRRIGPGRVSRGRAAADGRRLGSSRSRVREANRAASTAAGDSQKGGGARATPCWQPSSDGCRISNEAEWGG